MSQLPGIGAGTTSFDTPVSAPPGAAAGPGPARRHRGLTIGLTTVIGVLLAAAVVATAVIIAHRSHHTRAPAHPLRGTIFQVRQGQCINSALNGTAVAHVVPCAQAHDAQIYGIVPVAGYQWPGSAALSEKARQSCQAKLNAYLNQDLPPINVTEFYVYPDRGAWAAGGRSVICEIRGIQGKLTGSVPASGG